MSEFTDNEKDAIGDLMSDASDETLSGILLYFKDNALPGTLGALIFDEAVAEVAHKRLNRQPADD